jgi:integrase
VENLRLREPAPTSVNVTVGKRGREYLTDREVERLVEAAKQNRSGNRDATAILVAYRHGLRASELVAPRWDDIDLATGRLHVRRAKSGDASVHPISSGVAAKFTFLVHSHMLRHAKADTKISRSGFDFVAIKICWRHCSD